MCKVPMAIKILNKCNSVVKLSIFTLSINTQQKTNVCPVQNVYKILHCAITSNVLMIFLHLGSTVRSWQTSGVANTTGFCANVGFFCQYDSLLDDSRYTRNPY